MLEVIKLSMDDAVYDFDGRLLFLAIGTFDGVHLGHRKLITTIIERAQSNNGIAAAYTFSPHPTVITEPNNSKPMIRSIEEKYRIFSEYDLYKILEQRFDQRFAEMTAQDFIKFLKRKFPTLRSICVGENFKFGHNRLGTVTTLIECSKEIGISSIIVPSIIWEGERISSSRIRKLIKFGDFALAEKMLGSSIL
jgi:riboflavin kinase/FMN adenylyltransferase